MNAQLSIMDKFLLAFKAEGLKLKRRKMIKLSYLIPLFGLVLLALVLMFADTFREIIIQVGTFEKVMTFYVGFFMMFMFPTMIAVYTASISSIEREAKTGFTLGVLPTSPFLVFLTKILKNMINTFIGTFIGISSVVAFALIANSQMEWFVVEKGFFDYMPMILKIEAVSLLFLPIIILHTWLGERFNIKLLNLFGMIFLGILFTSLARGYETNLYLPYSLPFEFMDTIMDKGENLSYWPSLLAILGYIFGLLYLVYLDLEKNIFKRKK